MLTIAITGSNGEVGRRTVLEALKDGHTVIGLDRGDEAVPPADGMDNALLKRFTYKKADLTNRDAFLGAARGSDALIHLAAVFHKEGVPESSQIAAHVIHNVNTVMSWNALDVAAELGHKRVSLASSINAIGLKFSKRPTLHYLPLDEEHPCNPEDAYSVSKLELELQARAFARRYPSMRIACIRPHWVIPESLAYDPDKLCATGGLVNDLWAWTSAGQTSRAFLLGLTAPESTFPVGAEAFFVVAPTTVRKERTRDLIKEHFPEVKDLRCDFNGNEGLYDCRKAERMLGWTERAFAWSPEE